jgi:hypothetical protein
MTTLAAQPGTLQASLIDALGGPEPERALEQAFIHLARGGDLPLVLATLKSLVRVGLAGIAVRLLHSAGGLLAAEPQLAALADQLAAMPQGQVPDSVLRRRFQSNVHHLLAERPHLRNCAERWSQAIEGVCVFRSITGNLHSVRGESAHRTLDLIFPFADQAGQARTLNLPGLSLNSSFLLVGVPNPSLFARLLALKTSSGYQPPIDVLETDADVFGLWLHLIDEGAALSDERVSVFAGNRALDEYREFLVNHRWRRPATYCITNFRPRWNPPVVDRRFQDSVATAINQRQQAIFASLEARCAGRDVAWWSKRLQQTIPLQIAGFTSRYSTVIQHSMRDLASAFERCGHAFDLMKQPNDSCAHVDVVGSLSQHDYDLIVVIDHLRAEFARSIPPNIPYVCWIQDHMDALYQRQAGASVTDLDVVIGHSPGLMHSAYGYPLDRFIASTNLTDAHTYSAEPLPEHELAEHRCDVSYVGHGSATPLELADEMAADAPKAFAEYLRTFVRMAQQQFQKRGWLTFADRMELALSAERESGFLSMTPDLRRRLIVPAIDRLFDRMVRHQTLEWTAQWAKSRQRRFRIYGRGWQSHPTLADLASGEVANGRPLRAVYQASSVSMQITAYSSLHQRMLDGLCSGAMMIARFNPFDHLRRPHSTVRQFIKERDITNLDSLRVIASREPVLATALAELESLGHARLAAADDHIRRREAALYREVFDAPPEALTDDGLFDALRTGQYIPHRSAIDLPGFELVTFQSAAALHGLLDRFVDDGDLRRRVSEPMRLSVLANDTYDVLVRQILGKFGTP